MSTTFTLMVLEILNASITPQTKPQIKLTFFGFNTNKGLIKADNIIVLDYNVHGFPFFWVTTSLNYIRFDHWKRQVAVFIYHTTIIVTIDAILQSYSWWSNTSSDSLRHRQSKTRLEVECILRHLLCFAVHPYPYELRGKTLDRSHSLSIFYKLNLNSSRAHFYLTTLAMFSELMPFHISIIKIIMSGAIINIEAWLGHVVINLHNKYYHGCFEWLSSGTEFSLVVES